MHRQRLLDILKTLNFNGNVSDLYGHYHRRNSTKYEKDPDPYDTSFLNQELLQN
jgi:hypothetical protein